MKPDRFTFAIPLIARASSRDWQTVEANLNATLRSLLAQTDPRFDIILAGTDRPASLPRDARLSWIDVPPTPVTNWRSALEDAGRKRQFAAWEAGRRGGGYLMFVDADDLVSRHVVTYVRRTRHPHGYVLRKGYVLRLRDSSLSRIDPDVAEELDFSLICGTSVILNLSAADIGVPETPGPTRYQRLFREGHVGYLRALAEEGNSAHELPFPAAIYVTQTGENLSTGLAASESERRRSELAGLEAACRANPVAVSCHHLDEFGLDLPLGREAPPKLSLCIITYQRPQGLARLLRALNSLSAETGTCEIVVVNDGSDDQQYRKILEDYAGSVRYVALKQNLGIPGARNAAAAAARGEWIVYIDDDCVPRDGWLDWLRARLRANPELDAVGGTTTPLEPLRPTLLSTAQRLYHYYPRPRRLHRDLLLVTANFAIRRDCLMQVGGFATPHWFAGAGEDTELSVRLQQGGYRVAIDANWVVAHDVGDGYRRNFRRLWRYGLGNGIYTHSPQAPSGLDDHFWFAQTSTSRALQVAFVENFRIARHAGLRRARGCAVAAIGALLHISYVRGWREGFRRSPMRQRSKGARYPGLLVDSARQ